MPQGTPVRRIRVDDDLWDRFGTAVETVDPEMDRSKMLRQLIRWYIGDSAEPPQRPAARDNPSA
jgi:hypothetical protein